MELKKYTLHRNIAYYVAAVQNIESNNISKAFEYIKKLILFNYNCFLELKQEPTIKKDIENTYNNVINYIIDSITPTITSTSTNIYDQKINTILNIYSYFNNGIIINKELLDEYNVNALYNEISAEYYNMTNNDISNIYNYSELKNSSILVRI